MAPWLIPFALVVGVVLGALGGGGAILTVPVLTSLVGLTPAQATTASLVIVGSSSLLGLVPHARAGRVRVREGGVFGLLGVVGAAVGSRLSILVPGPVLMSAFSVLLLVVAVVMGRRARRTDLPQVRERGWGVRVLAASAVGLLTGFFGVGGGFVVVPALTLVLGLPMSVAAGTSLLVVAINSASSLLTRAFGGVGDRLGAHAAVRGAHRRRHVRRGVGGGAGRSSSAATRVRGVVVRRGSGGGCGPRAGAPLRGRRGSRSTPRRPGVPRWVRPVRGRAA